jgi:Putative Flp pilus-assembly TadE/G-like
MHGRLRHLARDERGMSLVWTGIGFMAFFAATTLAIDVGMFMTARSQAQNSADGGALAGVTALVFNDWDNRSSSGPAVQSAISTALSNQVIGSAVDVTPTDVTFPIGPTGLNNRVKVDVFRTSDRLNPVATMIGPIFGVNTVNISATATAEASPANAVTCVKPFTIPARWQENNVPANDMFDRYDNHGNVIPNPDVFPPPTGGISWPIGTRMTLRAGTGNNIESSFYFSWKMPGSEIGGDFYRENIANCNWTKFTPGGDMTQEPGNKVGETNQGIDDLLLKDPKAEWDATKKKVINSDFAISPRVFPIPLYDPDYFQDGITHGRNASLKMVGWVPFFLEKRVGNEVYGYVTTMVGTIDPNAGPAPAGSLIYSIRLVQ